MAKNYQQDGTTLDYLNSGNESILSGELVAAGEIAGVAHDDIPVGLWGTLHTTGVFILPKAAEVVQLGQKLYLAEGKLTTAAAGKDKSANPLAGTAWRSAGAEEENIAVRLGY